jgi:type VI protein secretion system component Hcp
MERKIVSKTNDTSNLDHDTFEDRDMLEDTELNAVTGGLLDAAAPKLYEAACKGTHLPQVVIE